MTGVGDSRTFSVEYIRCGGLLEKLTGGDGTSSGSVQNQRDPHLMKSTKQINRICDKYTLYAFSLDGEQSHTPHASMRFRLVLTPPASSSFVCKPTLHTSFSSYVFSRCYLVTLFLCGALYYLFSNAITSAISYKQ